MNILISSCLLGEYVRYDGSENKCEDEIFENILKHNKIFSFCPEVEGGLSTPREAAEIHKKRVLTKKNEDFTKEFILGAKKALDLCKKENIKIAILKSKSPSCGNKLIYNGEFSNTLIKGRGICTSLLEKNGIKVFNENEINQLNTFIYTKQKI